MLYQHIISFTLEEISVNVWNVLCVDRTQRLNYRVIEWISLYTNGICIYNIYEESSSLMVDTNLVVLGNC